MASNQLGGNNVDTSDPLYRYRAQRAAAGLETDQTDINVEASPDYQQWMRSAQTGQPASSAPGGGSAAPGGGLGLLGGSIGMGGAPPPAPAASGGGEDKASALGGFAAAAGMNGGDENGMTGAGGFPVFTGVSLNGRLGLRNAPILRGLREAGVRY